MSNFVHAALVTRPYPRILELALVVSLASTTARAEIVRDGNAGTWLLRSGPVAYRLRESGQGLVLESFGAAGRPGEPAPSSLLPRFPHPGTDLVGSLDGRSFTWAELRRVDETISRKGDGSEEQLFLLRHPAGPLELAIRYATWGDTGTISRQLTATNRGSKPLRIDRLPSLAWRLPAGDYELSLLRGGWGKERQLTTEAVGREGITVETRKGRSTNGTAAWFALREKASGVIRLAQLAHSGNWTLTVRPTDRSMEVEMGIRFDAGGPLVLPPGESIDLPQVAFTATAGDLDAAANQLHRYQRRHVIPKAPGDGLPKVQFNTWYPYSDHLSLDVLKRSVEAAASLGCEVFVLDAGWFVRENWEREIGDWEPDTRVFPAGISEFGKYVHDRKMGLGLWVEIECAGVESRTFRDHPDWCLKEGGRPVEKGVRRHLDFGRPEVRSATRRSIDRLIREAGLEWIKFDYNIDIGDRFDASGSGRSGDVLYRHLSHYLAWLDDLRAGHPGLVVESCSSGGLRFDLAVLGHSHTTWISDEVRPIPSLQLAYGATVEFPPAVCNHWMVGDSADGRVNPAGPPGWWDFLLRVPMNGQFGISSRVLDWPAALTDRAREAIALYKRVRPILAESDCYHLTPPPDPEHPRGWMALQYVTPDRRRGVLMAYRLAGGEAERRFRLRGLDPGISYRVRPEGSPTTIRSGRGLVDRGLPVRLDGEWRANVIEFEAAD